MKLCQLKGLNVWWNLLAKTSLKVLEFVICNCKKKNKCETNKCQCFSLDMKCTHLCNCKSYFKVHTDEDIETTEEDDDYKNFNE